MATATLTITDINLDTGQVQIDCNIEGSMTDDGFMTAAEVMMRVVHAKVNSEEFRREVWAEVAKMTEGAPGVEIANDDVPHQNDNIPVEAQA
ncbi:hypothetical protein vBCbaSRXM_117 [Citromicrobium phage vB_CbaS-RXM]|nr:hypothetical protein vBCbaSRXM_117 [Citromicrobium phage vB_CbaS-RXM]